MVFRIRNNRIGFHNPLPNLIYFFSNSAGFAQRFRISFEMFWREFMY